LIRIDFYFDFISPYSYLAAMQLPALAEEYQIEIEWTPVNLPKLIKRSGNVPPATIQNKAVYSLRDLKRWASYLGIPFKMVRPGSFDSRPAMRIAAALQGESRVRYCLDVFDAIWSGAVNTSAEGWLDTLFEVKRLPSEWRELDDDCLDSNTQQALNAGAFGVPTFVLHGEPDGKGRPEMFFGVDHLSFLIRAIEKG